jgi:hypothetical protein
VNKPKTPTGLGAPGRRLWFSVVDEWELEEHEIALLVQAVRCVDHLDKMDALVAEGLILDSPQGTKAHPALVEGRQQRVVLTRLVVALRLPVGEEGAHLATRRSRGTSGAHTALGVRGVVA